MALVMIDPTAGSRFLWNRSAIDRNAVIGHLRGVLNTFAAKPQYSKFYIGITGDLEERLEGHRRKRPDFKLMIPVYSEPGHYFDDSFDTLERDAIAALDGGILHPQTGQVALACDNRASGISPRNWLYILVG
jgi:hypothetical protein